MKKIWQQIESEKDELIQLRRVFGLHVAPDLPLGTVGRKAGLNNAGVDHFAIHVQGKSAHAATPQLGVDALVTGAAFYAGCALSTLNGKGEAT